MEKCYFVLKYMIKEKIIRIDLLISYNGDSSNLVQLYRYIYNIYKLIKQSIIYHNSNDAGVMTDAVLLCSTSWCCA